MEWLLSPIDPSRGHEVGFALSWHARFMTIAWGVIVPAAILVARYFKILPNQDWPKELDNPTWWKSHWIGQSVAYFLAIVGLILILTSSQGAVGAPIHRALGWVVMALGLMQALFGYFRGSKGGPTARAPDGSLAGDHYDMTRWRLVFEHTHRTFGYLALFLGMVAILTGLWAANAPRWMWICILGYWTNLAIFAVLLQRKGMAVDTYQAIWGPDPELPGNKMKPMGWKTVRPGDRRKTHNCQGDK